MSRKMTEPLRVAILTNIIPRYRTPVFSEVARDPRFQLRFYVSIAPEFSDPLARKILDLHHSKTINIRWGTRTQSEGIVQKERLPLPLGLPFDLARFRPNVIISGDMGVRSSIALLVARWLGVPLYIWSEEILAHDTLVNGLQKRMRRFLLPKADGFIAWGKSAFNNLLDRGVSGDLVTYCAQAVNNDEWASYAAAGNPEDLRQKLAIRGRICLAVGRLLPRKGFKEMLVAFAALPSSIRKENSLVLVGDGPERDRLANKANELGIENFFMVGPKSPQELAIFYRAADFMVLPSLTDVWGLVVNEAMACGTPVISSIYAGVTEELVNDTGIGESFDPNDQKNFTETLERWLVNPPAVEDGATERAVAQLSFDVSIAAISRMLECHIPGQ